MTLNDLREFMRDGAHATVRQAERALIWRHALQAVAAQRAKELLPERVNNVSNAADRTISAMLLRLGISSNANMLAHEAERCFGLSEAHTLLTGRAIVSRYRNETPLAFEDWTLQSESELVLHHAGSYTLHGAQHENVYRKIGTRSALECGGYLLRFRGRPLLVHMKYRMSDMEQMLADISPVHVRDPWEVSIRGEDAQEFAEELTRRALEWIASQYRGKPLNHEFEPIELGDVQRANLVLPPELAARVDELTASLHRWYASAHINRWGVLFAGAPGTGKTTLGRLLAQLRPSGVTFLYAHASKLVGAERINAFFQDVRHLTPVIVQVDDVDLIGGERYAHERGACTAALLDAFDQATHNAKMFIILTTNDPLRIDTAITERPGRVHRRIVVEGFEACVPELLQLFGSRCHIAFADGALDAAANALAHELKAFTPDSARNACERIAMHTDGGVVTAEVLERELRATFAEFHAVSQREDTRPDGRLGFDADR